MGGFDLPLKESSWAIVAVVFIVIIGTLAFVWTGYLKDWNPAEIPGGPLFYSPKDIEAIQSVEALVCAINSVAEGQEYQSPECLKYWGDDISDSSVSGDGGDVFDIYDVLEDSVPADPTDISLTGQAVFEGGRARTLCHRISYYYYCSEFCQPGENMVKTYETEEECNEKKRDMTTQAFIDAEDNADVECSGEGPDFKCSVTDFGIPQEVSGYEEWIPYHGDPYYLVYWQNFPQEEDTWNYRTSATTYIIIGAISVVPWGKVLGKVSSKLLDTTLDMLRLKKGSDWAVRFVRNIGAKIKFWKRGGSIVDVGRNAAVKRTAKSALGKISQKSSKTLKAGKYLWKNKGMYDDIAGSIDDIGEEAMESVFKRTEKHMSSVAVDIGNSDAYFREYSKKLSDNFMMEISDICNPQFDVACEALKNQMTKEINEKVLKVATRDALREGWAARILDISGDRLKNIPSIAMKAATLTGAARALEIADSIIKAREDKIPNTVALKKPLSDPYVFPLTETMEGRPVFVNLQNVKDYFFLPELFDDQKQLHLASPCHLESMEVDAVYAQCGKFIEESTYSFDSNGVTTGETEIKTCVGEIEIEYQQNEPLCEIEKYEVDTSKFSDADREFIEWLDGLEEVPDGMFIIFNETTNNYTIPVGKDSYAHYSPSPEGGKTSFDGGFTAGASLSMIEREMASESVALLSDREASIREISTKLLECFEIMGDDYTGNCVVFDTEQLLSVITEKDVEEWMMKNLAGDNLEKAKDLKGDTGWDNMDWDIDSISAGNPRFVAIFPSYSGVNEVHVDEIDNKNVLEFIEKDGEGNVLKSRDIQLQKRETDVNDVIITVAGEDDIGFVAAPFGGGTYRIKNEVTITLSDMGDEGVLRSVTVSKGSDYEKVMTEMDFSEDGFEKYSLKNCHTPAVLVTEMKKASKDEYDVNYCTRGETWGGAMAEWGTDVGGAVALGIVWVSGCSIGSMVSAGGTCAAATAAVLYVWGAAEVITEGVTKVGGWPRQTW